MTYISFRFMIFLLVTYLANSFLLQFIRISSQILHHASQVALKTFIYHDI